MGNFLHQSNEQEDEIVGENVTRFNVDKCKKKPTSLKKQPLNKLFSYRYGEEIYRASFDLDTELSLLGKNAFLQGYLEAYLNHCPIAISPDIIWEIILIGFSTHIDKNSEQLRDKLVNFKGKETLKFFSSKSQPS